MIFRTDTKTKTETSLKPGDVISVSKKGAVAILRLHQGGLVPLYLVEQPGVSWHYFNIRPEGRAMEKGVGHEYAWIIARMLAGIAGLYVEDNYVLSKEGHHQFPVTVHAPAVLAEEE